MGFYGNITNTTSSQFTFDKIYPNRQAMDAGVTTDGVYVNRFVLIEYDTEVTFNNNMTKVYSVKDGVAYLTESDEDDLEYITNRMVKENSNLIIIYTATIDYSQSMPIETNHTFYKYSKTDNDNDGAAKYLPISENDTDSNYIKNYSIDIAAYPDAKRGYDSTVWQKMYVNNEEKYVMIAELNSVVPTFDVSPDAPTMNPIAPHFDANSTNVYYKLHWQAPWGFRVAQASNENLSDEKTTWTTYTYNEITNTHTETKEKNVPAAIYYNKKAFEPQVGIEPNEIKKHSENITEDEIKVTPTGKSGNKYNKHDGTANLDEIEDIQEMTIHLPSIGNMMSDAWDIIHGPARNDSKVESLQGILNTFKDMESNQIPYKRLSTGEIVGADLVGDNWISATLDDGTKKINIIHQAPGSIAEDAKVLPPIDFNEEDSKNYFTYHTLETDSKGHVKEGVKETKIILPNGFNEIQNANGVSLVKATTPRSAFKIATDNWIHVEKPEGTNDTFKLYHEARAFELDRLLINENKDEDSFAFYTFYEPDPTGHIESYQMMKVYFPNSFSKVETDKEDSTIAAGAVNSTFKIGGDNAWTETEVDDENNKILVKHKVKESALKEDYYEDLYERSFFDAKIDEAGHIIEYRRKVVPASLSAVYAHVPNAEPFKISADFAPGRRSVDIYGDSFITLSGNTTTQKSDDGTFHTYKSGFTINHALPDQFEVSSSTQSDAKEIITYNDSYDGAGHRVGRDRIIYKLPNYYSAIEIPTKEGAVSITPNAKGSIIFKGKSEEKEISDNIKTTTNWITVSGDKDSNTILIDHGIPNKEDPKQIKVGSIESIEIPYFSYDSKGHIIKSGVNQIAGDDWLSLNQDNYGNITISHNKLPNDTEKELTVVGIEDAPTNPKPGQVITVPYIKYDEKGHIIDAEIKEVTLPSEIGVAKVVINDEQRTEENKNKLIMNAISVSEESGNVIPWYTTTKNLLLNDYNTPLSDTGESSAQWMVNIGSGDSINSALGKLEYKINNLSNSGGGSADFTVAAPIIMVGDKALTSLSYINNQLVPCYTTTNTFKISGYYEREIDAMIDLTQPIGNDDTINTALRKLSHQATFKTSGILTTISDLNNQVTAMGPIRTDFNNLSNFVMFTLSKNVDALEARIQALETALAMSQGEEILIDEDEIEQIANNLDNV